jgi:hypothetical protein
MNVVAILGAAGQVTAPRKATLVVPPKAAPGLVGVTVAASVGDYRAGDEIWCAPIEPEAYGRALNRDVIVPRPAGRFLFGRLIGREGNKLQLLPAGAGSRQQVVTDPPWVAMAVKLVRSL